MSSLTSKRHHLVKYAVIYGCFSTTKNYIPKDNQGTSGPVNAHLTPGPGVYFNAFIHVYFTIYMYIAPGRGRQSIGDTTLTTTEMPFVFVHMLQVSK